MRRAGLSPHARCRVTTFPTDPRNDRKPLFPDLHGPDINAIDNIANSLKSASATASRGASAWPTP
jgi:hypothetical protein